MITKLRTIALTLTLLVSVVATSAAGALIETEPATTVAGGNGPGDANNQLSHPGAVVADSDGNLYITDSGNNRIQKLDTNGTITTVAGGNGPGDANDQLASPLGVAVDSYGVLFIADSDNNRIQRVASSGFVTTIAGGNGFGDDNDQLASPYGVAVDSDGVLYIADTFNHRIQKIAIDGTITTVAGGNGHGDASNQLSVPSGVAIDTDGNLYIADYGNNRIQKIDSNGSITTAAGGNGEGDANNQLNDPFGVAVDNIGNLYIADTSNHRIQRLVITTYGPREIIGSHAGDTGIDGSISRLYMAIFQRQPDNDGHRYWVARLNSGMYLHEAAYYFVTSTEFTLTYANLNNQQFVELLYQNVMNRQGENAGVTYWTNILNTGTRRADVTLLFSESPEFKILTKTS